MSDLPENTNPDENPSEPVGAGESGDEQAAEAAPLAQSEDAVEEPVADEGGADEVAAPEAEDAGADLDADDDDDADVPEDAGEEVVAEGDEEAADDDGSEASGEPEEDEDDAVPAVPTSRPRSGPLELIEEPEVDPDAQKDWYILKVSVNREPSIAATLERRVKMHGLEQYFGDIIVPTEEQTEFTKAGKKRKVKKKLYPGYIVVNMAINDETWFLVRETSGIGDFTGAAGKPAPLQKHEIDRILNITNPKPESEGETHNISHKIGDRVRVNEGYFQNFEGLVDSIDVNSGRVTVLITIFNRTAPVELEHWHIEAV